jgi:MoaA/NifB/PqqE/SkfB family radical SAM enzyme
MGFSVDVTRENADTVTSDEFIDLMIEKGAYIGWYFLSMPIGKCPGIDFMPTPEQRNKLRQRRDYIRENKPLFIIDFWNDAPFVGGCIAGRQYIHINSQGDVEPCIFVHFATHNIKNCSLREALKSPFFKAIRERQPFNDNLFLPCMLIDNPEVFREVHAQICPYPTHEGAETIVTDKNLESELDKYSKSVKEIYEKVWEEDDRFKELKKR